MVLYQRMVFPIIDEIDNEFYSYEAVIGSFNLKSSKRIPITYEEFEANRSMPKWFINWIKRA